MKSAVLQKAGVMAVEELPVPKLKFGEVLVKVMACGVCGTDVHIFSGDKGAADNPLPIVLGHEFAGVIEEVGEGVGGIAVGQRVCVDPNVLCGHCYFCKSGMGHFCQSMVGIGTTVNGGFAQYCAVPAQQVYTLADNISFDEGAMAEPLACCLHGIDVCEIKAGSHVVVYGGGMIGLLMLQLARLRGAAFVALVEPVSTKRSAALALGADMAIDPSAEDTTASCLYPPSIGINLQNSLEKVRDALKKAGVRQVDTVIECVGRTDTIKEAIEIAGKQSVVMMFGLTKPDDELAIKPFDIFKKEVVLKASFINPYTIGRAVGLINNKKVDVSSMMVQAVPLEKLGEVLASPALRSSGKHVVHPW